MSEDMRRRDTLKLASALAALGAGLGVLLRTEDAAGQVAAPLPEPRLDPKLRLKVDSAAQLKIDGYRQVKIDRGFVQIKLYAGSEFVFAANLPNEIARLFTNGTAMQFKFHKPTAADAPAPAAFAETALTSYKIADVPVKPSP